MAGKKGKSGRPRQFNDPYHKTMRKIVRKYYYEHKEKRLAYARRYHKKIKDYADKHEITFEQARKQLRRKKGS